MRVLLTGGGTAGHINPALAIAQIIKQNIPASEIAFVGVRGGKEEDLVTRAGYPLYFVKVMGFQRSLSPKNLKALWMAYRSPHAKETVEILEHFMPDLVIGTGGYACWPIMACAARMGIPTAIHESNALPGLTVKKLQGKVDAVWVNFAQTKELLKVPDKTVCVGNPLRQDFSRLTKREARQKLGIPPSQTMILSFGGSLGAENINLAVINLMKQYTAPHPECLHFHASGKRDAERTKKEFQSAGLAKSPNCILTEYFYDMPYRMAAADIVISRAGAMTLSELSRMKKTAILIPSPYVADNHQYRNAKTIADAGGAILVEESELESGILQTVIEKLCNAPGERAKMEQAISAFSDPDANQRIWQEIKRLSKQEKDR